jgi:hypothetical protein
VIPEPRRPIAAPPWRSPAPSRPTAIGAVASLGALGLGLLLIAIGAFSEQRHFGATRTAIMNSYAAGGDTSMNGPADALFTQTLDQVGIVVIAVTLVALIVGIIGVLRQALWARVLMLSVAFLNLMCTTATRTLSSSGPSLDPPRVAALLLAGSWLALVASAAALGFLIADQVAASRLRRARNMIQAPHQQWSA